MQRNQATKSYYSCSKSKWYCELFEPVEKYAKKPKPASANRLAPVYDMVTTVATAVMSLRSHWQAPRSGFSRRGTRSSVTSQSPSIREPLMACASAQNDSATDSLPNAARCCIRLCSWR